MKNKYLKLDPSHPYYRICLWSLCEKPQFMASRKDQDYCCKDHFDKDYNRYRRLKNQNKVDIYQDIEKDEVQGPNPAQDKGNPIPSSAGISEEKLAKNIEIFSGLFIDERDGTIYTIAFLEDQGVDLRHYSYSFPLYNIKNGLCILFGKYHTFLISPIEILIYYKP